MKAASISTQRKWIPKNFQIDEEFGCLTNAERLEKRVKGLKFQVGRTRLPRDKWGDHAWCITPKGSIIDPYFKWRFPNKWHLIEYQNDDKVFDGNFLTSTEYMINLQNNKENNMCDNPNCKSDRIALINGKTSDLCQFSYKDIDVDGYVPQGIIIGDGGYGDYITFNFCLECGKIQGKFPISDKQVKEAVKSC